MARPKDDGQYEDHRGDRDQAPWNSGWRAVQKFLARRLHVFGAGQLQVGEFFVVVPRRGLRFQSGLAIRRERALFRSGGMLGWGVPDFVGVDLGLAKTSEVVGDGILVVETEMFGVCANESLVEDTAGKLVELLLLDGLEHARADFGGVGNIIERDAPGFARLTKFVAELAH